LFLKYSAEHETSDSEQETSEQPSYSDENIKITKNKNDNSTQEWLNDERHLNKSKTRSAKDGNNNQNEGRLGPKRSKSDENKLDKPAQTNQQQSSDNSSQEVKTFSQSLPDEMEYK